MRDIPRGGTSREKGKGKKEKRTKKAEGAKGMVLGIGTDILHISRLHPAFLRGDDPFRRRVFTEREIAQAQARAEPLHYYATRFAGKEAVFKTLQMSPERVDFREIEILDDGNGVPLCRLYGALLAQAQQRGRGPAQVHISLSWETDTALAFALLERIDTAQSRMHMGMDAGMGTDME